MSAMENVHGWDKLLGDPFFQHIKAELEHEDVERLLTIIGEDLYSSGISFSIENAALGIPGDDIHKEVIGAHAEYAKGQLYKLSIGPEAVEQLPGERSKWLHRFLSERTFRSYVFRLFDFLIRHAQNLLPNIGGLPSLEDREKGTVRDNAEELEEEIEKVEAARKSAEEARKAAEEARSAAEEAKTTAEREMGRVEAARRSAEEAGKAAEEARSAVEEVKTAAEKAKTTVEEAKTTAEKANTTVEEVKTKAEEAERAASEAKTTADSIMPNMLTTLGVFVAIVIAVVACYLSVLLAHHAKEAGTLNMAMILLMGHILLNIIFLLLYLISKMSAHSLACHCLVGDQMDCLKCAPELRGQCRLRHKLWLRYPYVVAMNGVFVMAYCVLGLWYLMDRYLGTYIDEWLKQDERYAAGVVGAIALVMVLAGILAFATLLRGPKRKEGAGQEKEERPEDERESTHELWEDLKELEERNAALEEGLKALTTKLEKYEEGKSALVD